MLNSSAIATTGNLLTTKCLMLFGSVIQSCFGKKAKDQGMRFKWLSYILAVLLHFRRISQHGPVNLCQSHCMVVSASKAAFDMGLCPQCSFSEKKFLKMFMFGLNNDSWVYAMMLASCSLMLSIDCGNTAPRVSWNLEIILLMSSWMFGKMA